MTTLPILAKALYLSLLVQTGLHSSSHGLWNQRLEGLHQPHTRVTGTLKLAKIENGTIAEISDRASWSHAMLNGQKIFIHTEGQVADRMIALLERSGFKGDAYESEFPGSNNAFYDISSSALACMKFIFRNDQKKPTGAISECLINIEHIPDLNIYALQPKHREWLPSYVLNFTPSRLVFEGGVATMLRGAGKTSGLECFPNGGTTRCWFSLPHLVSKTLD